MKILVNFKEGFLHSFRTNSQLVKNFRITKKDLKRPPNTKITRSRKNLALDTKDLVVFSKQQVANVALVKVSAVRSWLGESDHLGASA